MFLHENIQNVGTLKWMISFQYPKYNKKRTDIQNFTIQQIVKGQKGKEMKDKITSLKTAQFVKLCKVKKVKEGVGDIPLYL